MSKAMSSRMMEFFSGLEVLNGNYDDEYAKSVFDILLKLYQSDVRFYSKMVVFDPKEKDFRKKFISPLFIKARKEEGAEVPYNSKGLYLIGNTSFNPYTDEKFYWVKIGMTSATLKKRMSTYATHNPSFYKIDFLVDEENKEHYYHLQLAKIAIEKPYKGDEWFRVSRENYLAISEKGFKFF